MTLLNDTVNTAPTPVHPAELPTIPVYINKSGSIRKFSTIPKDVEAVQFQGWSNANSIFDWTDGVMFVPRGYEHPLRYPDELDENGRTQPNAPEFLSVKGGGGDFRVDLNSWLVKNGDGQMHIYNHEMFSDNFSENMY